MAAVKTAGKGLSERLAANGSVTLYAVDANGKPIAITLTAVSLTLA